MTSAASICLQKETASNGSCSYEVHPAAKPVRLWTEGGSSLVDVSLLGCFATELGSGQLQHTIKRVTTPRCLSLILACAWVFCVGCTPAGPRSRPSTGMGHHLHGSPPLALEPTLSLSTLQYTQYAPMTHPTQLTPHALLFHSLIHSVQAGRKEGRTCVWWGG